MRMLLSIVVLVLCTVAAATADESRKSKTPSKRLFGLGGLFGSSTGGSGNYYQSGYYGSYGQSATCRYWCKTPENQFYCCENLNDPIRPIGVKPGSCPPVRPNCLRSFFGPPQPCSNDGSCAGTDKCCFDRCLEQHVCKPISSYYNYY